MIMQHRSRSLLIKAAAIITLPVFLAACSHLSGSTTNTANLGGTCAGNRFLMRFGCSLERVQRAAQSGNADAQYALGYMYYYGIGTVQDRQTGTMWIKRAADQGQPLARRAMGLLARGGHPGGGGGGGGDGGSIHQPKADVASMNSRTPEKNMKEYLPAYGKSKKAPVLDVLKSAPETAPSTTGSTPSNTTTPSTTAPSSQLKKSNHHAKNQLKKSKSHAKLARRQSEHHARGLASKAELQKEQQEEAQLASMQMQQRAQQPPQAASANQQALSSVEQQMLQMPSRTYTLQLMGSHDLAAVKSFVRRHKLADKVRYYSANYHGKPWYMLIYGDYASILEADTAISQLPPSLRAMHPWVKSFRLVQKEIKLRKVI